MSEKLSPEQVVEILNDYLDLTSTSIFKFGGTLDKFIGDATMAIFNAPLDLDDYVFKAVCTALEMRKGADRLKETMTEKFGTAVSFGIGVNCGPAVVGNIGATFRMEYTAIGDTVNTAARLESNAKPGQILISEAVYERVKHKVMVTPIGEIPLKGKSKGVFVYQLDSLVEEAAQTTNEVLAEI
jgi:adenylate cyclase